jgi:putative RNA 2'-phosphotransferase
MLIDAKQLSKLMSHALRHEPWIYELELDDEGWVDLEALINAAREARPDWPNLAREDIVRVLATSTKKRYELAGARIRALYGHSLPGKLKKERAPPPPLLFHGTSPAAAEVILAEGLKAMSRQYVHLSVDTATALEVGRRKHPKPILFELDAQNAHNSGVAFYSGNEKVWLADAIPAQYLRRR